MKPHMLAGDYNRLKELQKKLEDIPVDETIAAPEDWQPPKFQTTIAHSVSVSGPATYYKGNTSVLTFEPTERTGWWIDRTDLPEQYPIQVAARNVWTASRAIVLRTGNPHNYLRMSEHIISQRLGLGLDNLIIRTPTGDPPLFDVGSMPIVDALLQAGIVPTTQPLTYQTITEPVAIVGPNNKSFLLFLPPENNSRRLSFDVAIDFPTAIGKQRIRFDLCDEAYIHGAHARTNCSSKQLLLFRLFGWLFADTRHIGYTKNNILIAGQKKYINEPALIHEGKSLEAVWHRACLDLLAALSLIESGRLAGNIISYKAGHSLDCRFMTLLGIHNLLRSM